jgi:predicted RND superfamily exporter protein
MAKPPVTEEQAVVIAKKASRIPFLKNTLISEDEKAIALYLPISSKKISYQIAQQLKDKIQNFSGSAQYHITGLPVAQDQFGVEMFKQMAISAPAAMVLIFILMWIFFKNIRLILSPILIAFIAVIFTMGLLVITGHTVHIMSSMIPIFIMPIAVLDAVHILSDFFDRYPVIQDRRKTIRLVMEELSAPMFYTTITTCAGFGSLAFTPIPPVQVFGVFIALGVFLAWLLTITLIPAYIMLMSEDALKNFGLKVDPGQEDSQPFLSRLMFRIGNMTYKFSKIILMIAVLLTGVAYYGITQIEINDNPVKWFQKNHEIRIADRELNARFAGTYMAYLVVESPEVKAEPSELLDDFHQRLKELPASVRDPLMEKIRSFKLKGPEFPQQEIKEYALHQQEIAESDASWDAWDQALMTLDELFVSDEVFKRPEVLNYIEDLQRSLAATGIVGKSNALTDIVKTVHRELFLGEDSAYRIPDTRAAVAQTLITYQNSHRPQDLWHFVNPGYRKTVLWVQLNSGDNRHMNEVVRAVDAFFQSHPSPLPLKHKWFGLTYINTVWQDKMVAGMMEAFLGSFVVVFGLMVLLFRSLLWGILSMIPLAATIAFIYGVIGLIGKDYDMPVAVLSSLSLGLAVDYAIHFLARSRHLRAQQNSWRETLPAVFGEPARAITRNVIVIGVGFLPLLAATLVPYQTVGAFISAILLLAGVATLFLLPALIRLLDRFLFKAI